MKAKIVGYLSWAGVMGTLVAGHLTENEGLINIGVILFILAIFLNILVCTLGVIASAFMLHQGEAFPEKSIPTKGG